MREIKPLVELCQRLTELKVKYSSLNWTYYTTGMDFGVSEASKVLDQFFEDKKNYELVSSFKEKSLSPENARRVEILANRFEPYHQSQEINQLRERIKKKEKELSGILNTHRVEIEGKKVTGTELSALLSKSDDPKMREKAFRARAQVNRPLVEGGFIELINMRRDWAKLHKKDNYVDYALERNELSPALFSGWRESLIELMPNIKKEMGEFAKKYLGRDNLAVWDREYLTGKICEYKLRPVDMLNYRKYIAESFQPFGFEIDKMPITFDIFPRSNKSEWGYHFTIEMGKDARILANVSDEFHNFWVLMHEAGHGVHYGSVDPKDSMMNMGISGIISEGLANLFGRLIYDPEFYLKFFKSEEAKAREQFGHLKKWSKTTAFLSIERILFDQALLKEKIENHDDILELRRKFQSELGGHEEIAGPLPWAFLIHHTTHPVYLHNYFMGDVTCNMLKNVFLRNEKSRQHL